MPTAPKTFRPSGWKQREKTDTASIYDRPGAEWLHSVRWRKARKLFLAEHPLCIECERHGHAAPATDVDHIKAHKGDYALFWDEANWQAMCHPCHSRKTARKDRGFGNIPYGGPPYGSPPPGPATTGSHMGGG